MFSFTSSDVAITKSAMEVALALVAAAGDPKATASRLAEMQAKLDEIVKQNDDFRAATAASAATLAETKKQLDAREADLSSRESGLADLKTATVAADARIATARDAENKLVILQNQITTAMADADRRQGIAKQREIQIANAQAALDKRATDLAQQEDDYAARMAKLKALAG